MDAVLEAAKDLVVARIKEGALQDRLILIKARVLSAREAIGNPETYDFPLLKGKEKMVEADYDGHVGHAYTDMAGDFQGTLGELFGMAITNNYRRALQAAAINALVSWWGLVDNTVHCKDGQPKACARRCRTFIEEKYPQITRIAFVGYQPALLDIFSKGYQLKVFDLDKDNIGQVKFGHVVLDPSRDLPEALSWAELVLATGSTLTNGTIDDVLRYAGGQKVIFYGVTIAGTAALLGLSRVCFSGPS